ncbi:MAG: FtsX-like permease family protein [Rikenellaceae bacterium]|nr:FtsX-like permease family protein [Rikenellaceae bacterium]
MASNRDKRLKRKVRRSYVISTVSISLVLFLLGIVSYVTFSAIRSVLDPAHSVTVSVELSDELFENEKEEIYNTIAKRKEVESIKLVSQEEGLEAVPFEVDMELLEGENPLNDCIDVTLKRDYATKYHINTFASDMEAIQGVAYVDKPDLKALDEAQKSVSGIALALLIFVVVLLIISLLLLNNTLRLAIYSKRYLINTMKLVGATKWYIMRPLLISALKQGFVAGIIASALTYGTIYGISSILPMGIKTLSQEHLIVLMGIVLIAGVIITVGFSAMAINKFINMKSNKIHLY